MPIFVLFIFSAVVLGAGSMLAPAWPTAQPRVALAATFSLAIIVGGTVFYSALFGWDTLVIDYLLFALVVGIFLGGTLSFGQARAENRGEVLEDKDQGWPGPQDLAIFAAVAALMALPILILPVPFGDAAQNYGYMALVTGQGGTFDTFAPFYPEVEYLYAPGFNALTAYLSQQLGQGLHTVQFSVGAVLALVNIWLAYDFGAELRNKRLARAMALTMLLSLGVFGMLINGHFTALLGLAFLQAFVIYAMRYLRDFYPVDIAGAGLMFGATMYSSPTMAVIALLGFVPWLGALWISEPRPPFKRWLVFALGIPLIAFLGTAPWLADIASLLQSDIASPFERSVDHIQVMIQFHGYWVIPAAILGAWLGWQRRDAVVILCMVWLFFIVDFSTTGGIAALLPFFDRFVDPEGIAWHGPIIPYTVLGGMGVLWLWENYGAARFGVLTYRQTYGLSLGVILAIAALFLLRDPLRDVLTSFGSQTGALASEVDIEAMRWIREHTPEDARILNFPDITESAWASVITERETVYFPQLPYALPTDVNTDEQRTMLQFWRDPSDFNNAALLRDAGIDYIIVPQIISNPGSLDSSWRWAEPDAWEAFEMQAVVSQGAYLAQIFVQDGAEVYAVLEEE